jgi:hypothetical protein
VSEGYSRTPRCFAASTVSGPRAVWPPSAPDAGRPSARSDRPAGPLERARRPLRAALTASVMSTIGFGSKRDADRVTARVRAMHRRVPGRLWHRVGPYPAGTCSRADDPEPSGSRVRTRPLAAVAKALNVSPNRLLAWRRRPVRAPVPLTPRPREAPAPHVVSRVSRTLTRASVPPRGSRGGGAAGAFVTGPGAPRPGKLIASRRSMAARGSGRSA